jgi:hypothetical protein
MLPIQRRLALLLILPASLLSGGAAHAQGTATAGDSSMPRFPVVKTSNLDGKDFTLPRDFEGGLNLIFIAFQRRQQEDVDTWLPLARQLEATDSSLRSYELPTIRRGNPLMRWMINRGMASGIDDPRARASTLTLYLDKSAFRRSLAIVSEEEITVLLVERDGEIDWRSTGTWSAEKEKSLRRVLQERNAEPGVTR